VQPGCRARRVPFGNEIVRAKDLGDDIGIARAST
jgi:hypothetical protein